MEFKKNIGQVDKVIRVAVGLAALGAYFANVLVAPLNYVLLLVSVMMFFTVATSSCMLYTILRISSCAVGEKSANAAEKEVTTAKNTK